MMMSMPLGAFMPMQQQPQQSRLEGLLGNPLLQVGIGLLAAGQDGNINPYAAATQGMQRAQAFREHNDRRMTQRQQQEASKRLQKLLISGNPSTNQIAGVLAATGDSQGAANLVAQNLRAKESEKQWANRFQLQSEAADARLGRTLDAQQTRLDTQLQAQSDRMIAQLLAQSEATEKARRLKQEETQRKEVLNKLPALETERDNLAALEKDILRAQELQKDAWFGATGPLAEMLPDANESTQELASLYKSLGIGRLDAFKGSLSEKEMAAAFQAGAHMGADSGPNLKRLDAQLESVRASMARNQLQRQRLTGEEPALIQGADEQDTGANVYPEGTVIQNAQGERMVMRNGNWMTVNG